jgi:hypothetical protein
VSDKLTVAHYLETSIMVEEELEKQVKHLTEELDAANSTLKSAL